MNDIIVIGGGGHAKVVISIVKKLKTFNIIGYTDINNNGNILGADYIGTDNEVLSYSKQTLLALGIGQVNNLEFRKGIVDKFIENGYRFTKLISPDSNINEDVSIGAGTVIMDGVTINCCSLIGDYCIVNTNASIDHDCSIGDFVHVAPGVTICGGVQVYEETFIGAGSIIVNDKKVNAKFIKASSLVK